VTQLRDELVAMGEIVVESKVVRIALRGVYVVNKHWEVFVRCIVARENLPGWNRLWDDLTHEELIIEGGQSVENNDEKDLVLVGKSRRRKGSSRNLGKVRCFGCGQLGHLVSHYPEKIGKGKEREKATTTSAEIETFTKNFEQEFSMVTMVSSIGSTDPKRSNRWVIDNGASCHMIGI